MFIVSEAEIICTYIEILKCQVNVLIGVPENTCSLKRTLIALYILVSISCVEEPVVVKILTWVFLVGFIGLGCPSS